jgi:ribosome-binding factor A
MYSNRQLRAAELLRRALAEVFVEKQIPDDKIYSVTVSEVRISPDLRNATVYILHLGGEREEELMDFLERNKGKIRYLVTKKVNFKNSPMLHFKIDRSFDQAMHMHELFNKIDDK